MGIVGKVVFKNLGRTFCGCVEAVGQELNLVASRVSENGARASQVYSLQWFLPCGSRKQFKRCRIETDQF